MRLVIQLVLCHILMLFLTGITLGADAAGAAATPDASAPDRRYGAWRSGAIGGGGYLQQVHFCPSDPRRLYLTSDVGGFYRSDDLGQTWRMLHGRLPAHAGGDYCRGLRVDPDDADRFLVAVDQGIYLTTDGGQSFRQTLAARFHGNGPSRNHGLILVASPRDKKLLLAAADQKGVFRSTDGGETWTPVGPTNLWPPSALIFDRTDPRRVWLCVNGWKDKQNLELGLWTSADAGLTWTKIADDSPSEFVQDPRDPGTLYGLRQQRPVRSTDAGRTWRKFDAGLPAKPGGARDDGLYAAIVAQDDVIALGGHGGNFYTLDRAAQAWVKLPRGAITEGDWWGRIQPGNYTHFGSALGYLTINPRDPQHWIFTDWYALYQSHDGGRSWALNIDGIELTVFHGVTQEPTNPRIVHAAMADIGYFRSDDGGASYLWKRQGITNNIRPVAVTPAQPGRLYAVGPQEWQWHCNQVFISDDTGDTWRRSPMKGLPDMKDRRCNTIMADPATPDRVYLTLSGQVGVGAGGVYRSDDGGQSWRWLGRGLPAVPHLFRTQIWVHGPELAVSSDGSLVAISIDRALLFRWTPASDAWQSVNLPAGGQPFAVFADPHHAGRYYLCLKEGGLWRSDNGGQSWIKTLNRPAYWLGIDLVKPGRLALVTGAEVLLSLDEGKRWAALDGSLPYRHLRNQVCFAGDRVIVGTGGNGAFWTSIADAPAPTIPAEPAPPIGPTAGPQATPAVALLQNGDMEQGDVKPEGWDLSGYRQGTLTIHRDVQTTREGKSALALKTKGKAAGFVHQLLKPTPKGAFVVKGFARAQGEFEQVQVALQVFDAQWKQIDWKTIATIDPKRTEWTVFEREMSLPDNTAYALLGLSVSGDGTAWLDGVSVVALGGTAPRPEAPKPAAANPAAGAAPLPVVVAADDPRIHYVGRFDARDPRAPRATWSHAGFRVRFKGAALNALLVNGQYQVVIDGKDAGTLRTRGGVERYRLADNLSDDIHVVELWKRTEPCFGVVTFKGVEISAGGTLLEPGEAPRSIEFIGDSVTTGHGNEGTNPKAPFGPDTQNAWQAFGAVAARMLAADYVCVGWSARKMWPNDTISELYDYAIPQEKIAWDFTRHQPAAVVISLGANDFRQGPPEREGWCGAYVQFLEKLRARYPQATLIVASAPTLAGGWRQTQIEYLKQITATRQNAGDKQVALVEFSEPPPLGAEGFGANHHPTVRTHHRLAGELAKALETQLGWKAKPLAEVIRKYESPGVELPVSISPADAQLRYVGRFARAEGDSMRCAWPHSSLVFTVQASAVQVGIADGGRNRIQVLVNNKPTQTLQLKPGSHLYTIAQELPADRATTITLIRATEALFGELSFTGLKLAQGGKLVPTPAPARRIEIIGDSISAGYGIEAPDQTHKFAPETENAALTYGSLTARAIHADLHVIAWSGKTLWPRNTLPEIYGRVLPANPEPKWDPAAAGWSPDVVLINLGTNDFAGGNPEEAGWVKAYVDFVAAVRRQHPQAFIYLAIGPMLSDPHSPSKNALTTIRRYVAQVETHFASLGDRRVRTLEFATQQGQNGFGADWHPSRKTNQIMADKFIDALRHDLNWTPDAFTVSTDFPGGNAVIEGIDNDVVRLRPDLRDTEGDWFYWAIRVRQAQGRTLRFVFSSQNPLADRGPALSLDGGITWRWLGRQDGKRDEFTLTLPPDARDVILGMGMTYTRAHWDRFLAALPAEAPIKTGSLTKTRKNRDVPTLQAGRLDGGAKYRVLVTARSHACEMMASYVLEGLLAAVAGNDELGRWYRAEAEVVAAPFVDVDGVEDGDQGKNRKPRDHNRDYVPPHAHVETAALVALGAKYFDGRPAAYIDLHCPWIHGPDEEKVFLPGQPNPEHWAQQQRFAEILEKIRTGPIPYQAAHNLPFGQKWNTNANGTQGLTGSRWAAAQPGMILATSVETPYATASGTEINPDSARALGRDLAHALRDYLQTRN